MKIPVSIHPEPYKQLLRRSLKLYRHALPHVFLLSLLLSIMAFIPRLLSYLIGEDILIGIPLNSPQRAWLSVINLGCLIFFAAMLWRIRCLIRDAHESLGDDMKIALKKIPYILVTTLIQNILLLSITLACSYTIYYLLSSPHGMPTKPSFTEQMIGLFFLSLQCILVVYIFFSFIFYLPTIVIENKGIISSLQKSASLVWKNWWRTFSLQITPWVAYLLILVILKLFRIKIHIYFIDVGQSSLFATFVQIVVFALILPWMATNMLVQLRDLELRQSLKANTVPSMKNVALNQSSES